MKAYIGRLLHLSFFILYLALLAACSSGTKKEEKPNAVSQTVKEFAGEEVIPLRYRSIYIHNFDDRSYRADLVGRLKQRLQVEFQTEGRLKVKSKKEESDLWLYGKIEQFTEIARSFDNFGQPTMLLATIVVSIKVRINPDSPGAKEKTSADNIDARELDGILLDNKLVRLDITYTSRLPPFESQFNAHQRLLNGLALRVRKTVLEGWYSDLKSDIELGYDPNRNQNTETIERSIRRDIPKEQRDELLQRKREIKERQDNPAQVEFKTPDQLDSESSGSEGNLAPSSTPGK